MNINRNNYEMYFLLYIDNELSAAERNAIEKFVKENIDLKKELELLRETALPPEAVMYSAKSNLYKNEKGAELLQEKMLLCLDNESDPLTLKAVEDEIERDEAAKREWSILQHTRLDSTEKIIFENKHLLYRHERDRVVTMRFWKIAIAAAFIGAGIFTGIRFFSKDTPDAPVVATDNKTQEQVSQPLVSKEKKPGIKENFNDINRVIQRDEAVTSASQKQKNIASLKKRLPSSLEQQNNSEKQLVKKESGYLPKFHFENINREGSNEKNASAVTDKNKEALKPDETLNELVRITPENVIPETAIPVEYNALTETPVSYAKNAVFEDVSLEINNDRIFYMNEEKISRSKVSGLFRRVKRVIERNTKIKTRNGLKIAGFEVAVR